ncbi:12714_t:CDS:2 [Cetraspora pellucida]|uniref:12714_t:CDS:1 n=1 Tax=Cetraspora pellucida TaxID=1433469 RepID=A0A9N9AZ60_9GLOM|nr:12714_t:CDS:2 [Cetraspora pellucida]
MDSIDLYFNKEARIKKYRYILVKLKDLRISLKYNLENIGGFAAITRQRAKTLSKRMFDSSRFNPGDWSQQELNLWLKLLESVEQFYAFALIRQNHKVELVEFLRKQGREEKVKKLSNDVSAEIIDKLYTTLLSSIKKDSDYFNYCRGFLYKESKELGLQDQKPVSQSDLDNLKVAFLNHYKLFEAVTNDHTHVYNETSTSERVYNEKYPDMIIDTTSTTSNWRDLNNAWNTRFINEAQTLLNPEDFKILRDKVGSEEGYAKNLEDC